MYRKRLHLSLDGILSNNKIAAPQNSSNENYTSDCSSGRSKSSDSLKRQNFQLRKPEYRVHTRIITSTCGKPIYCFKDEEELLTAFYDAIEGHRNLFRFAKILHGNISLYNIMIGADGRGFIIDLDYAIDLDSDQALATECDQKKDVQCRTLPFMAIEILKYNAQRKFKHDLESFFYVLCWICSEYEGPRGQLRDSKCERKSLMNWVEGTPETIGIIKSGMMLDFEHDVLDTFSPYFDNLKDFMVKFHKIKVRQTERCVL
ncbi:hypothetical protein C1646_111273 [Rhizophagus diaphanus]|nr:hypothetical protein C1646_111273 [Rhizophagus diaphanus] [Rhizophagus sp. MUCL 43196]